MADPCAAWTTKTGRVTVHTGKRNANRLLSPAQAERLAYDILKAARHARLTSKQEKE